jgi:hypothetical protein
MLLFLESNDLIVLFDGLDLAEKHAYLISTLADEANSEDMGKHCKHTQKRQRWQRPRKSGSFG